MVCGCRGLVKDTQSVMLLGIKQFELYPETLKLCSNILTASSLSGVECLGCPGASTFGKASP